jgi:hypothetical protein
MEKWPFRVVQPWGRDKGKQSTLIASCPTAQSAFDAIDRMAEQMVKTGAPSDAVELVVLDAEDRVVRRPES